MKINAYKIIKISLQVFLYTHSGIKTYNDFKSILDKNNLASFSQGQVISLNKIERDGFAQVGTRDFNTLYGGTQRELIKKAICKELASKGLKNKAGSCMYFGLGSDLPPQKVGAININLGFEIILNKIHSENYIFIDPLHLITEDGNEWKREFAMENYSILNQNPLKYREFINIIDAVFSCLGESVEITFDTGTLVLEKAGQISDDDIKNTGPEPKISFGGGRVHTFPAAGLKQYGPWDFNEAYDRPKEIKVGVIGGRFTIPLLRQVHTGDTSGNRYAFLGFEKVYKSKLIGKGTLDIKEEDITQCNNVKEVGELFRTKARELSVDCDVAIIALQNAVLNFRDTDLRDYLKVIFWEEKLASQIILESTVVRQDSLIVDNLALGIYVAAGGKPWILEEPFTDQAFIGISFGVSSDNQTLIGIVEIFDGYGMSIAMNVKEIKSISKGQIEEKDKHIDKDSFIKLLRSVIAEYSNKFDGNHPQRIVIHKTTYFDDDELSALDDLTEFSIDFVPIYINSYGSGVHLITDGADDSPPRHTYWQAERHRAYLYTKGPNESGRKIDPFIPKPLTIELQKTTDNSTYDMAQACTDIIKLTKLNWNSVVDYEREPVTISHSRKIVDLLRAGLDLNNIPTDLRFFL